MAKPTGRGVELEPIDRLEEKLKRLVELIDRMKADSQRAGEENDRLTRELDALRARVASGERLNAELTGLREERDVIRAKVGEMLEQLDALNL